MSAQTMNTRIRTVLMVPIVALSLAGGAALAKEVTLRAAATTKTMPDGTTVIPMWGFALEPPDGDGTVTVPGPQIEVPPGDTTLIVHVNNTLSEPVSVVIPGQTAMMMPAKFADVQGRQRARSFTHETAPGQTGTYTWTNLRPGTYLYHSGTHPAVQVQMGLYGVVTSDSAAGGTAYPGVMYDQQVVLLYSEIDPALHQAVADGTYGTPPAMTSTIEYDPKYFLINGRPYSAAAAPVPVGAAGSRVLVRFLNAGLETHVPTLLGAHWNLIAEDGNPYPYSTRRYSLVLPAGQTKDVLVSLPNAGSYPVYDRRLNLTDGAAAGGGMLTFLAANTGGTSCLYDIDGDGFVGPGDFAFLAPCWMQCSADPPWTTYNCGVADFDGSGCVDVGDFAFFATAWLKPCTDPTIVYPP